MPFRITSTTLIDLLNRFGVRGERFFSLAETIQPVALVDSSITIESQTGPTLGTPVTAGEVASGAAGGAVMADTGALAAGTYLVRVIGGGHPVATFSDFRLQRRDAANAANIWAQYLSLEPNANLFFDFEARVTIADQERIRVVVGTVVTTGVFQFNIWTEKID